MSLSLESARGLRASISDPPPPSSAVDEGRARPDAVPSKTPATQVHPAAGTLRLPPSGQRLGLTTSGSTESSWSNSSDAARPVGAEDEGRPSAQPASSPEAGRPPSPATPGPMPPLRSPPDAPSGQGSTPGAPLALGPTEDSSSQLPPEAAPQQGPKGSPTELPAAPPPPCEPAVPSADSEAASPHQPVASHSAPTVLDDEKPRPPSPRLLPGFQSRTGPQPADLWKTAFWIIEDFQAPCPPCRSADEAPPAAPAEPGAAPPPEVEAARARAEPASPAGPRPPYYDLEPEDLASYRTLHPCPEAPVRDSEMMGVPDEDLEFWGKFYFVGVDTARQLLQRRKRPQK